jgi:uncharacterized protein YcbX
MSAALRISALAIHPIKSCAALPVDSMRFDALGPVDDRRWMLIDQNDEFLTQREAPRLALVRPHRAGPGLRVQAPGMPPLDVTGIGGERRPTMCWDDRCSGFDEGPSARAWFSQFLGQAVRLLRFDASAPRRASGNWVGAAAGRPGALTRFSDGFPLLVTGAASLAAVNERLQRAGVPPIEMVRFRPNVVIEGLEAFEEDAVETLTVAPADRPAVTLRLVKPCARCTIPEVDPATGRPVAGVLGVLASFRANPRLGGAPTFGQNAIVAAGLDGVLRVGDPVQVDYRF